MTDEQLSPRVSRRLVVAAGMLGVVLGLLALATMFAGKRGGDAAAGPPTSLRPAAPDPSVPAPRPVTLAARLAERRDPFRQVVTVPKVPLPPA